MTTHPRQAREERAAEGDNGAIHLRRFDAKTREYKAAAPSVELPLWPELGT